MAVLKDVFAAQGLVVPFLFFVAVAGAAVGFAALAVGAWSSDIVGALSEVSAAPDGGAVVVFGAGGLVAGDLFLFGKAVLFHMTFFDAHAIIVPAPGRCVWYSFCLILGYEKFKYVFCH